MRTTLLRRMLFLFRPSGGGGSPAPENAMTWNSATMTWGGDTMTWS